MNRQAFVLATALGTVTQLLMVVAGHYDAFIRDHVFALGGMAISLVAGLIYGWRANEGWRGCLKGGAISGGVCAFIGIFVSAVLKDTVLPILAVGTAFSAATGLIGGFLGGALNRTAGAR